MVGWVGKVGRTKFLAPFDCVAVDKVRDAKQRWLGFHVMQREGGEKRGEMQNRGQYSVYFLFCPRTFSAGYFSSFITIFLPNAWLRSILYRSASLTRK